ncbi:sodium:solute symporter family transporter, partial [Staphylococcus simulans]
MFVVFFTLSKNGVSGSGGKHLDIVFVLDYRLGLILILVIVIAYTFFGGYLAVSLTDFFQGVIMLIAMIMVPIGALLKLNGLDPFQPVTDLQRKKLDLLKGKKNFGINPFFEWGLGWLVYPFTAADEE